MPRIDRFGKRHVDGKFSQQSTTIKHGANYVIFSLKLSIENMGVGLRHHQQRANRRIVVFTSPFKGGCYVKTYELLSLLVTMSLADAV